MSTDGQDDAFDLISQFRIGLAGLSCMEPADQREKYWADAASAMTRVIEAWSVICPRLRSTAHGDAITALIDQAMDAFACRDDKAIRVALKTAYSAWVTLEFTEQVKNTM